VKLSNESAMNQPKTRYLSRLMLFSAPIAFACVLSQMSYSTGDTVADQVNRSCAIDDDDADAVQAQADRNFFDTSWLPSRSEFEMVVNNQSGETMWNPLGKNWLTPEQVDLLGMAYTIGYQDGGEPQAKLVQAVLLQETIAGRLGRLGHLSAPLGKRSYGVMQVKVVAARDVLRHQPELGYFSTDEQLITRLISDDEFNIRIASAYLKFLRANMRSDQMALVAYNIGLNAARGVMDAADFKYVQNVERYLAQVVKRYNTKFPGGDVLRTASM
jgi:hypothetical protein